MKSTETSNFNSEPVSLEGGPNYSDTMSKTGSSCILRGSGGGGGGGGLTVPVTQRWCASHRVLA